GEQARVRELDQSWCVRFARRLVRTERSPLGRRPAAAACCDRLGVRNRRAAPTGQGTRAGAAVWCPGVRATTDSSGQRWLRRSTGDRPVDGDRATRVREGNPGALLERAPG